MPYYAYTKALNVRNIEKSQSGNFSDLSEQLAAVARAGMSRSEQQFWEAYTGKLPVPVPIHLCALKPQLLTGAT